MTAVKQLFVATGVVVSLLLGLVLGLPGKADAYSGPTPAEQWLANRINYARVVHGRAPLHLSWGLSAYARSESWQQAFAGRIYHIAFPLPSNWQIWGQNVGCSGSTTGSELTAAKVLDTAFWDSPEHRANVLDSRFTRVGIGLVYGAGQWWVTENFMSP